MTRLLREARGWTQEHLAVASDLSVRTIQRVEAGHPPSSETLMALASVFNVGVGQLQDPGPHVLLGQDALANRFAGSVIKVYRHGFLVSFVVEIDSRRRTFKRLGALLLDVAPDRITQVGGNDLPAVHVDLDQDEEGRKRALKSWENYTPPKFLVDGKEWVPEDNLVEDHYDAVILCGPLTELERKDVPKHWVRIFTGRSGKPMFSGPPLLAEEHLP